MPCYHPVPAYRIADKDGSPVGISFAPRSGENVIANIKIACGQCIGCRQERARQWAVRCVHEVKLHAESCAITLTYNDAHCPDGIEYSDFQRFMKRLRKRVCYNLPTRRHHGPRRVIRFFACGEYGELRQRPHFHALIFGYRFADCVPYSKSRSGTILYTSAELESLWVDASGNSIGHCLVGDADFDTASYIARYLVKKHYGRGAEAQAAYGRIDIETGELYEVPREMVRMSLKPGIGAGFFERYHQEMYPFDRVVVNGKAMKPPRYYTRRLAAQYPEVYDEVLYSRELEGRRLAHDNEADRLEVKEVVAEARSAFQKREL